MELFCPSGQETHQNRFLNEVDPVLLIGIISLILCSIQVSQCSFEVPALQCLITSLKNFQFIFINGLIDVWAHGKLIQMVFNDVEP